MSGLFLFLVAAVLLLAAYWTYGKWLERRWGIDPQRPTPAHVLADGVDYVPAPRSVLFGHQFSSIAGAGPINGPIIAAMFGWLPVLLWILIGGIFCGAVQDFAALYASVKNQGRSIGYVIDQYIGKTGKRLFMIFVWLFSILVVAAFADIVAGTFDGYNDALDPLGENAAVASTSIWFILAAVGLGFFLQRKKPGPLFSAIVAVALLIICVAAGLAFPIHLEQSSWLYLVFAYIFVASITPVWALLQPRDYLCSFLLVALIFGACIGVLFARPVMELPAFTGFVVNGIPLFPILFVTVACGAVSGFHALVASGTTSKQLHNERDILPISFGAMLLECLLAVLALVAVGSLAVGGRLPSGTPPVVFAQAVSGFLAGLGLPASVSYTLVTLAISCFALTSLDSVARIGRLAFQEFFTDEAMAASRAAPLFSLLRNKHMATFATLLLAYLLARVGYQNIWPLFGSANQLLAALSLVACAVFLKRTRRLSWMLYLPFCVMLVITFTALGFTIHSGCERWVAGRFDLLADGFQLLLAVLLLLLGIILAVSGIRRLFCREPAR